ncbi:MAG TPA: RNA 2',3'-cyclic phosphodiesterase [Candidatus Aquilonibacter sp.]
MRLFAGIELDQRTRDACVAIQDRLRAAGFDARYEPAEKLHITLAFLGRVDPAQIGAVTRVLDDVASHHPAFALTLDKVGAFPHERRPRVIFVGSRAQGAPIRALATELRDRYGTMGFTFEDDVVAHVTIARVKGGAPRPVPLLDVAPQQLRVGRLALFESLPDKRTTRYVVREVSVMRS